jgi:hypothetical protein
MPSNIDPEKIPDMSLPERTNPPPPVMPEASSAYQPNPEPAPAEAYHPAPMPAKPTPAPAETKFWEEGDRVLAPWEPTFLYAGTIRQIKIDEARGDQALVKFDDGDEGWVFLFSLCPLELKEGQKVLARRKLGPHYFWAEIKQAGEDDVHLRYDDGSQEWTTVAALRIPCTENGPGAVGTRFGTHWPPEIASPPSAGVPSWVWSIGLIILLVFLRIGCRAMLSNQ